MNKILEVIKNKLTEGTNIPALEKNKRWNIDEATFLILAGNIDIIDSYVVDNEHRAIVLSVTDNDNSYTYLVTYGYDESFSYSNLEEVGFDFAHFLFVVERQNIPCNRNVATDAFLSEYLFTGQDLSIEQVKEYLPKCYGSVCSYLIKEPMPASCSVRQQFLIKIVFEHELQTATLSVLPFDNDTITAYNQVINNSSKHIPIESVFLSLLERKYKFCFLDLFRCLERLFRVSMTHEFEKTLQSTINRTKIAEFVKQYAGNGHQSNQIQYLFKLLPTNISDIITNAFNGDINVGNIFYDTRNDIVHYKTAVSPHECYSQIQWNALIRFSLLAIDILYTEFDNYLNDIPEI